MGDFLQAVRANKNEKGQNFPGLAAAFLADILTATPAFHA